MSAAKPSLKESKPVPRDEYLTKRASKFIASSLVAIFICIEAIAFFNIRTGRISYGEELGNHFKSQCFMWSFWVGIVLLGLAIIFLHELLHLLLLPGGICSGRIKVGKVGTSTYYVVYEGTMTRCRFAVVALAPAVVWTTIIPLYLLASKPSPVPMLFWWTFASANFVVSVGDFAATTYVLCKVPKGAVVIDDVDGLTYGYE